MLSASTRFESEIRAARQADGIKKAQGVKFGRKQQLTQSQILKLRQKRGEGALIKDFMKEYDRSKAGAYKYFK